MIKRISIYIGGVIVISIALFVLIVHYFKCEHEKTVKQYKDHAIAQIYPCLYSAIRKEFVIRAYKSGVPYEEWNNMTGLDCEGDYETKTVEVPDTTFQVQIKCGDLNGHIAIKQFIFKGFMPLNLGKLDSIFRRDMQSKEIRVSNVYIEYTDVKKKKTLQIGEKPTEKAYITEFEPIDILKSIGLKAWVVLEEPHFCETVQPNILEIVTLSIILLVILCALILWLIHAIGVKQIS